MNSLRNGLACALFASLTVAALQLTFLLAQAGEIARTAENELLRTSDQAQATLLYSQAVLASIRGTTETVRKSSIEQMGYYEAIGRRSSMALARLELLIAHTDARMERMTQVLENSSARANQSMDQIGELAASLREDLHELSAQGTDLAEASTAAVARLDQRLADQRLDQFATSLAESSENTAQVTAHVAEATGYIRDILSPKRKSFWRRLLELLIPRPTVSVP
ncbi:MAG: hypothetical protein HY651_05375 [Acidobacteria bacterium]|nr:hypothetical protein [Acidobacteriota bacterium]